MTINRALKILEIKPPVNLTIAALKVFLESANKAWKKLMIANHPDRGGTHEAAVLVNEAWDRIKTCKLGDFATIPNLYASIESIRRQYPGPQTVTEQEAFERIRQPILREINRSIFSDFIIKQSIKKGVTNEEKLWEELIKAEPINKTST